ncbi:MAG: type II CAAX prenyl endopeptidase Rce1 family protein, partial [Candidatus Hodarchaeota archaeon]
CPILIYIAHKLYSNYSQYQTKDLFKLTQLSRREVYEVLAYAGVFIGAWTLYGLLHGLILLPFSEFFSLLDSPILFIIAWGAVIDEIWFRWLFQGRLLSLTYSPTLRIGISASLFVVVKTSFAVLIMTFWGLPIAHWLPAVVVLFIVIGLSTGILYEYTNGLKTSSALSITTLTLMFASIGSTIFM